MAICEHLWRKLFLQSIPFCRILNSIAEKLWVQRIAGGIEWSGRHSTETLDGGFIFKISAEEGVLGLDQLIVLIFIICFMGFLLGSIAWRKRYEKRHQVNRMDSDKNCESDK